MFTIVLIIHIIVSIILIVSVLLQVGKGATIGSTFGGSAGSQTLFGSAGPATFLSQVTTGAAVIFLLTSLYLTYSSSQKRTASIMSGVPQLTKPVDDAGAAPQAVPAPQTAPAPVPEGQK